MIEIFDRNEFWNSQLKQKNIININEIFLQGKGWIQIHVSRQELKAYSWALSRRNFRRLWAIQGDLMRL